MRTFAAVLAAFALAPSLASAGDCFTVSKSVATKAVSLLKKGARVTPYCCGAPLPTKDQIFVMTSASVGAQQGGSPLRTVWFSCKGPGGKQPEQSIDLSQIYVETQAKSGKFQNVGDLAGCKNKEPKSIKPR